MLQPTILPFIKFRFCTLLLLVALLAQCSSHQTTQSNTIVPPGITKIETVKAKGPPSINSITIPYDKYVLDNGLTVILHQDSSDPLVHVDITYHVGSAREEIGKSGFAHFFEHMQFQGSENVGDDQHFKIVSEAGGTLNGTTNSDRTNYYQTVPSNQLEKILWLESDRMGYFLDSVTQKKFEIQRETVKNERGQNYDNRPYGLVREKIAQALYPVNHPYSWLTIGYIEDLNRVNVNDLKAFFLRWYGPNNATLTIGGDFDSQQALNWITQYFGNIPPGPTINNIEQPLFKLPSDRYISYEDNINLPLLYISFPTVKARHPDEAPLDVLSNILGGSEASIFYKNLVKKGLAIQAETNHPCSELSCSFILYALPNPANDSQLSSMEALIRQSLNEFEQRGVNDDDLARVKQSILSSKVYGLESVSGKVSQLAFYQTFTGNPNYIQQDIERYSNVTKEDVIRVYRQYINNQKAVWLSVVPRGQNHLIAAADNYQFSPTKSVIQSTTDSSDLTLRHATSSIDRSIMPPSGSNPQKVLPALWQDKLANHIEVLATQNNEVPTTTLQLRLRLGQAHFDSKHIGLAYLTAAMLNESTEFSSVETISNRLQKLGSTVAIDADDFYTTLYLRSLTRQLSETVDIAIEQLLHPKFDPSDFARVKNQILQYIETEKKQPKASAAKTMDLLLWGQNNTFAHPITGTSEQLKKLTLENVKQFYQDYYAPHIASIIAVSDLEQVELMKQLQPFAHWTHSEVNLTENIKPFPSDDKPRIYLIDKPAAAQSEIRVFTRALAFDASGDYFLANIMNYALGGAFNSRINLNLREDKGYTYGAHSYFTGNEHYGSFVVSTSVRTDVTQASIVEIMSELKRYKQSGMTIDEWAFTQNSIGQRDARSYETPRQKLNLLDEIQRFNLPQNIIEKQQKILLNKTHQQMSQLASRLINVDSMNILVVGDKNSILESLQAIGYEVVEIDENLNHL